jgi:hypothetical protein
MKVNKSFQSYHNINILLQINAVQEQIRIKQVEINDQLNTQRKLQDMFQAATTDSKFSGFLRKIYKKKYKPPKVQSTYPAVVILKENSLHALL